MVSCSEKTILFWTQPHHPTPSLNSEEVLSLQENSQSGLVMPNTALFALPLGWFPVWRGGSSYKKALGNPNVASTSRRLGLAQVQQWPGTSERAAATQLSQGAFSSDVSFAPLKVVKILIKQYNHILKSWKIKGKTCPYYLHSWILFMQSSTVLFIII